MQETPLHWAAERGHLDTVRCLVDKGAETESMEVTIGVSEWEYIAECKLVLLVRVCSQSPDQQSGRHCC